MPLRNSDSIVDIPLSLPPKPGNCGILSRAEDLERFARALQPVTLSVFFKILLFCIFSSSLIFRALIFLMQLPHILSLSFFLSPPHIPAASAPFFFIFPLMPSSIFPSSFSSPFSTSELARRSGLSSPTVNAVLRGDGTIASLDAVRRVLGLRWSFSKSDDPLTVGRDLASLRGSKRISQRAMAARLSVSPQTILSMETAFRGRCRTLAAYLRILGRHDVLAVAGLQRLVPERNNADADLVFTPRAIAMAVIHDLGAHLQGNVLDPCRGDGAFYDLFPSGLTRHWCEISEGRDFFVWDRRVDWIVTNPPFSQFRDFLTHSLKIADNIVFLCVLNHFTTKRRIVLIREAGFSMRRIFLVPTPPDWPSSGFQVAAVWLQRGYTGDISTGELDESRLPEYQAYADMTPVWRKDLGHDLTPQRSGA
ncbi:MAG: hypothetical protein Q4F71_00555 [Paracoccus sp. (in: a-proteobacteria)]|nr:hypothetical protein [Paracoccus sp. (in: a-proteobacteria)]